MRTVGGILVSGRRTTWVALYFSGRCHPAVSHDIVSSSFLCCVLRTRYLTCAVFPLASWRSHVDYFWSPFPCSVFCFFVPGTLTYAVFPSGDDSILYADDRRHFGFLAKYYLYSHGLFGEAPSGDIGFHT